MYILENDLLKLEFDTEINNITSLINKKTQDNYIKVKPNNPIFSIWAINKKDNSKNKFIPSKPTMVKIEGNKLIVCYDKLVNGSISLDAKITATVLVNDTCETKWDLAIENSNDDYDFVEVLYPHITGIYLGESYKDDTVIYPHHAGEKTNNPIDNYASNRFLNFWRANSILEDGVYHREINYCGLASMTWMYYYDNANGFYISSNDARFPVTGIRVETGGPTNPWMGFGFRKHVRIKPNKKWESEQYTVAVTCEDWHWGAKTYRAWIEQYLEFNTNPEFLKDEFVLNQCYNFKKDGQLLNRFENIPSMYDVGKEYGMRHMFIASWNRKGFDCNYPEYYPDMDLGTSMDLYRGCKYVNDNGGFVTFYINARIFDLESDFYPTVGKPMAIKDKDGKEICEDYGPVNFAVMCPGDKKWQKFMVDTAVWTAKSYGATGIYLDQLGSAEPFACYDESHSHEDIGEFNTGYVNMLKELKEEMNKLNKKSFLMTENCGDIYGSYVWGNLTWNGTEYDEHFNVFKYTFPEYVQVNMVNPRSWLADKEVRSGYFFRDMQRAILLGSVLWLGPTYKFNADNEDQRLYAKDVIALREDLNQYMKNAEFVDDRGLTVSNENILACRWKLDNSDIIVIGNDQSLEGNISFSLERVIKEVYIKNLEGNSDGIVVAKEEDKLNITITDKKLAYVMISY